MSTTTQEEIRIGDLTIRPRIEVQAIPTLVLMEHGTVVDKQVGASPKSVFEKKIQAHI